MSTFLISVIVSTLGGIIAYLLRGYISGMFAGQNSAQQALNDQKKMTQDATNPVTEENLIKKLEDGNV